MTGPLSEAEEEAMDRAELHAVVAAAMSCPAIHHADDLRVGIKFADAHPQARPFVIKAAVTMGLLDRLPDWPEIAETTVHLDRRALRITASGLVDVANGQPYSPRPPARRQRRQQAVDRPITDRPSLLSAIRRKPTDPARRRELVQAAEQFDRVRWIPADWVERPTAAAALAPGAAEALRRAAYGDPTPPVQTEASRRRQVAVEPVLDPPVRNPHGPNGGFSR